VVIFPSPRPSRWEGSFRSATNYKNLVLQALLTQIEAYVINNHYQVKNYPEHKKATD
jgi:hypothetical protein